MYVVQILERGIENQLHGQSSCTVQLKEKRYFSVCTVHVCIYYTVHETCMIHVFIVTVFMCV